MGKKSYNPFKMWGSYVGAILGFLVLIGWSMLIGYALCPSCGFSTWRFDSADYGLLEYGAAIGSMIGGFLIGWGIHSLVRKLRK